MKHTKSKLLAAMLVLVTNSACKAEAPSHSRKDGAGKDVSNEATLVEPRFFASGDENPVLLDQIRKSVDERISFARHYSTAFVACGTGCGSYWFVDRRSGAVIVSPDKAPDGQMIWDIETNPDSDVVAMVYGSQDGTAAGGCATQSFRWTGRAFEETSPPRPIDCPA